MEVTQLVMADGSTTIDGTSEPLSIENKDNLTLAVGFQFTNGNSAIGSIQGAAVLPSETTSTAAWEDMDGTDVSDGCRGLFARATHVRVKITSGDVEVKLIQ